MAIVTTADVQARLSSQAYTRLFAKSGGSSVDAAFVADTIADTIALIGDWTRAQFPDGLEVAGTVSRAVVLYAVKVVCYLAASYHTSASSELAQPYRPGFEEAERFFRRLNRDADARTVGGGRPASRAAIDNTETDAGVATNPYTRAADGRDVTGF